MNAEELNDLRKQNFYDWLAASSCSDALKSFKKANLSWEDIREAPSALGKLIEIGVKPGLARRLIAARRDVGSDDAPVAAQPSGTSAPKSQPPARAARRRKPRG